MARDEKVKQHRLRKGTSRRVLRYARGHDREIAAFLVTILLDAALVVAVPLLLKHIIDDGVMRHDSSLVVRMAVLVAVLAVLDAVLGILQRWMSARIGEGLIYDLRREVFAHVLAQPIAFFTRTQTGALVTRLNSDVIGAQQAFTSVLSGLLSNLVSVVLVVAAMMSLSWQLTLAALALVPVFLVPARHVGRRLGQYTAAQMGVNADLGARMTERFNVAGALLVKLFGDPEREDREYAARAALVRDAGVRIALTRGFFFVSLALVAALATALVYGIGGVLAVNGSLSVGALLALTALLARLYGPLTALSNMRVDVMTALISFERIFEVLDLEPLVAERPGAVELPEGPLDVRLDHVRFTYPAADEVSLASLESLTTGDRGPGGEVLHDVDLHLPAGRMLALVGPSGAGKSTITSLVARLHDPTEGAVRVGGTDLRDVTLASLRDRVGVVSQDAHLFHDTIRANLDYARPGATEEQMRDALAAAQVLPLVDSLPEGLDTLVGDRGHRLSGGEKQRLAIARLLLKAPDVVVLDEATAHLDSGSEAAVQAALDTALQDRTAIVVAHRLSTVRNADMIAVIDDGRVVELGTHDELVAADRLYARLHLRQFTR